MHSSALLKFNTKIAIVILVLAQFAGISSALLIPKQADAFLGFGDLVIKVGDIYQALKDIALGALRSIALEISNKFLTKFVNKLQEKYKIRNYLYYDRVLTDYYLNRYIADKITDPDMKQLYSLLERGFVSGTPTGTTGAPDPRKALIPRIKQAMASYYVNQGGIPTAKISSPSNFANGSDYFDAIIAYTANHPSFTEQNLMTQYGAFQSSATTAAQLEVLVGNGLKAGRIVGGTCNYPSGYLVIVQATDPASCAAGGGTWQASALDQARSFIDNPTATIDKYLSGSILTKIDTHFNPNNFWAVVGSTIGSFFFNQLTLDKPGGTLNEDPTNPYAPDNGNAQTGTPIDLDGDAITDGYDINSDGLPDVCIYGGLDQTNSDGSVTGTVGPPCKGSKEATTAAPPPVPADKCTARDDEMKVYALDLLNNQGVSAQQTTDMINSQFPGAAAAYYTADQIDENPYDSESISIPAWYASEPEDRPHVPGDWEVIERCQR